MIDSGPFLSSRVSRLRLVSPNAAKQAIDRMFDMSTSSLQCTRSERCRAYIFSGVINYQGGVSAHVKIINVQRKAKHVWYKYHGLVVNSLVVINVKSCLQFRSIQ